MKTLLHHLQGEITKISQQKAMASTEFQEQSAKFEKAKREYQRLSKLHEEMWMMIEKLEKEIE